VRHAQSGLAIVELAVVLTTALVILFGCIEVGRYFFVMNTVAEATRRGARVAVVTADAASAKNAAAAYAAYLNNFSASNVNVVYYTETGGTPTGTADTALVSVSISGYQHDVLIPFLSITPVQVPAFTTTLPVESMGIPAS
jgi:Flp pilus assembly protein TadG